MILPLPISIARSLVENPADLRRTGATGGILIRKMTFLLEKVCYTDTGFVISGA